MVQETFIRWRSAGELDIRTPRAYLVTIVSRLCIQHLESARVTRERYVGPWLPEPVSSGDESDPFGASERHESLSMAFLLLLESLTPVERAAFLLHDVFDYDYAEVARILTRSEPSCRQIVHRARQRITGNRPRCAASPEAHQRLLNEFLAATSSGNLERLVSVLADEVTLYADGGGKANAALRPITGPRHVGMFLLGAVRKSVPDGVVVGIERVNGQPGLVYRLPDGTVGCVLALGLANGRISTLFVITNPDKLKHVA
jgi:RNA polymerase sigma-70 factor (ECF subfamily)